MVATYRSSDTSPKERFVHHQAGDGGFGGSSYIDLLAFREKDANTAWTSASDGTLEERLYYCQNQHADVVALITAAGTQREMVRYSAYGVPFGLPVGDCDSDGACSIGERNLVQAWITGSAYDVRGDIDLDGDVDSTDKDAVRDYWEGVTLGRGVLSAGAVGNRWGVAAYGTESSPFGSRYFIRNRAMNAQYGVWLRRDPSGYSDGVSLFEYCNGQPIRSTDPLGLEAKPKCNGQDCQAYSVECYIEFTSMMFSECPLYWDFATHEVLRQVICIEIAVSMQRNLNAERTTACPARIDTNIGGIPNAFCQCDGPATFVSHTDTETALETELPIPSPDYPACKAKVKRLQLHLQIWEVDGHCRMVESGHVPGH